jgi:exonuclease V
MYGTDQDSNYGSDFNTDEEELLDDLLKAVAEHATVQAATPIPTPIPTSTSTAPEQTSTRSEISDPDLNPTVVAALLVDIEDGAGFAKPGTGTRLPKLLGREAPRSPWRSGQQGQSGRVGGFARMASRASASASASASPRAYNSNGASPSGMLFHFPFLPMWCVARIELTTSIRSD